MAVCLRIIGRPTIFAVFIPGWDIFTTGIYDVLDRYREMYGEDAVLQVARTDIGNISCSITPSQPDVIRALAMKGLEIRLSSSSGGYSLTGAQTIARHNRLWSVVCNQSVSPEQPGFPEFSGSGDTAIFDPRGQIAARARSVHEEFVRTSIPMAAFRGSRTIPPGVPIEMLRPVHEKYVPRHGPNLQASYLPVDSADASRHFASKRNCDFTLAWNNPGSEGVPPFEGDALAPSVFPARQRSAARCENLRPSQPGENP